MNKFRLDKKTWMGHMDNIEVFIGQLLGCVTVILGFFTYQVKSKKSLLILQMITCAVFCIHYIFIDAISAFALNAVGFVRNVVFANSDKKIFSYKFYPVLFAVIMGVMGVLSWQNIFSLFVILGLVINTLCLSLKSPQSIRKSILVSSSLVLTYDILVFSIGGIVYETVAIVSAIIGIIRYGRKGEIISKNS